MKSSICYFAVLLLLCSCQPERKAGMPMAEENPENALIHDWASKKVYDSLLVNDMESPAGWSATGDAKISFTSERSVDGERSLRLEASFKDTIWIAENARRNGTYNGLNRYNTSAVLDFEEPVDWSDYNRLSLWVYVHPGSEGVENYFSVSFNCDDLPEPELLTPNAVNYVHSLKAGQWNRVLWEIPELPRHRVTGFSVTYVGIGHGFGKMGTARFDIDRLSVERVDVEKYEGWEVLPGKISYCHTGYAPEDRKTAMACNQDIQDFQLIDENGNVVLSKPVHHEKNDRGSYQLFDFTELRKEGTYRIRAGAITTGPFRISQNVWRPPMEKAVNFFYTERCGFHVPGLHDVCHQDWQGTYNGETKVINGGWHDAGDMSQGARHAGVAIYGMLELAGRLAARGNDPGLLALVADEAKWGLKWLLKTRFSEGHRIYWSFMRVFTDNETGTVDDVIVPARNIPWINFMSAAAEAYAYRIFRETDPEFARACLDTAKKDWNAAMMALPDGWEKEEHASAFSRVTHPLNFASWGAVSSLHLYRITGDAGYSEKAAVFGRMVLNHQETSFVEGIPVTGYFYENPEEKTFDHFSPYAAFRLSPVVALAELCKTLPDHEDWIKWYGAVTLHSEYFLKRGTAYSSPYNLLPVSLYTESEIQGDVPGLGFEETRADEQTRQLLLQQIREGVRLSEDHYLRRFMIQTGNMSNGSTSIRLSRAVELALAYSLRNDLAGERLVTRQIEWILGANPFSQSLMYGEGYDYAPHFSVSLGNIVGSLPIGIESMSEDKPQWYTTNNVAAKEVWVVTVGRFLWNMAYTGTPALLNGKVMAGGIDEINMINRTTGETRQAKVREDSSFSSLLPSGKYSIQYGEGHQDLTLLKGCEYTVRCDPENYLSFNAETSTAFQEKNRVRVMIKAEGKGTHTFRILVYNGRPGQKEQKVELSGNNPEKLYWDLQIKDTGKPWVAVFIPDGDPDRKLELTGTIPARAGTRDHVRGLIMTGHHHPGHPWEETTPVIRQALEKDSRIRVDVSTDVEDLKRIDPGDYDFLVLNYCNWKRPDGLSDESKKAFVAYLKAGGGLLIIHFANGAFHFSLPEAGESDWPEFRKICRRVWDHNGGSAHDRYGEFTVHIEDKNHFITRELKDFTTMDELYYNQAGDETVDPLITARSKQTGKKEPLAWVYRYGSGRIFQTLLGHDAASLSAPEVQEMLRRAAVWCSEP